MTLRGLRRFRDALAGVSYPDGWEWSDECRALELQARADVRRALRWPATEEDER